MNRTIKRVLTAGASLALLLLLLSGQAKAGLLSGCAVQFVQYDAGPRLFVQCGNVSFYTNPGGGCHGTAVDDVKIMEPIALAAFLAGKKLEISYENGGTCAANAIYSIRIMN